MNCFVGHGCKLDCVTLLLTLLFSYTLLFLVSSLIILLLYMEFGNTFNFVIYGIIGMINIWSCCSWIPSFLSFVFPFPTFVSPFFSQSTPRGGWCRPKNIYLLITYLQFPFLKEQNNSANMFKFFWELKENTKTFSAHFNCLKIWSILIVFGVKT